MEPHIAELLTAARAGAGGDETAPTSAATPSAKVYASNAPAEATVRSNRLLSSKSAGTDVCKIILEFRDPFDVLEGQTVGVLAPMGCADEGSIAPRLYTISSPADGEHSGNRTITLTVQRIAGGLCSNYLCGLQKGDKVKVTGPYGDTFLMPQDPDARLLMICAGTGSAAMRAFTMSRERKVGKKSGGMVLFFDGHRPDQFPYFGPLMRVPSSLLEKHLVFSDLQEGAVETLADRMAIEEDTIADLLQDPATHIYMSGPKDIEDGVEKAFTNIAESMGQQWRNLRDILRDEGRYHIQTYWQGDPALSPPRGFEHEIRVTWGDCDPANIAYTGRLPYFALDAINAWWEENTGYGWYQMELDRNVGTPFVSMQMDFRAPVTPRDRLKCEVWPARLGNTSIDFRVIGRQADKVCFEGTFTSVFIVADQFAKASPPADIRDLVLAHIPKQGA